jgi:TolB-like protein/DNA-binding winged helix-turn-helix (wHTH) protein
MIYSFGDYTIDTDAYELRAADGLVPIEPQVFELIVTLIELRDRLVSKDELFERVWNGRIVSDTTLSSRIKAARRALGDDGTAQRLIRTVHGRGFRFVGEIASVASPDLAGARSAGCRLPYDPVEQPDLPPSAEDARLLASRVNQVMARPAVAVLPLANASGDPEQDYLADGLTEGLIAALSAWRWFPVISRNTAFRYRLADATAPEIGRRVGARFLLTGSLRRAGSSMRVTVALIDAEVDREIWSGRFDREFSDLVALEDELAERIIEAVEPEIRAVEVQRILRQPPQAMTAWDKAMRASWHINRASLDDYATAERLAAEAAEEDPGWSLPLSLIAFVRFQRAMMGWSQSPRTAFADTLHAARTALAVDNGAWMAHALAGVGELWTNGHYDKALAHLHHAISLNPSASWSYHFCGCISGFAGDLPAARFNQEKVFRIDPAYPYTAVVQADLALWAMLDGHLDEAVVHINRSLEWDPNYFRGIQRLVALHGLRGDREAASHGVSRLAKSGLSFDQGYVDASYPFRNDDHRAIFLAGLRRAGVNLAG